MIARQEFEALRLEVEGLFPVTSAQGQVLAHSLDELAGLLTEGADEGSPAAEHEAALGPALDSLEDLLEALIREAGWRPPGAATGREAR